MIFDSASALVESSALHAKTNLICLRFTTFSSLFRELCFCRCFFMTRFLDTWIFFLLQQCFHEVFFVQLLIESASALVQTTAFHANTILICLKFTIFSSISRVLWFNRCPFLLRYFLTFEYFSLDKVPQSLFSYSLNHSDTQKSTLVITTAFIEQSVCQKPNRLLFRLYNFISDNPTNTCASSYYNINP